MLDQAGFQRAGNARRAVAACGAERWRRGAPRRAAQANTLAERVQAEARRAHVAVAACAIDIHGNLVLQQRMNDASLFSLADRRFAAMGGDMSVHEGSQPVGGIGVSGGTIGQAIIEAAPG